MYMYSIQYSNKHPIMPLSHLFIANMVHYTEYYVYITLNVCNIIKGITFA